MARYNTTEGRTKRNQVEGGSAFPAKDAKSQTKTAVNHEGRTVWMLDEKSNLFFRATSAFAGQDTFYEKAAKRDATMIELVQKIAVADWGWTCQFLVWLRSSGNMRTAPIMLAVEAVRARLDAKAVPGPGEMSHRALIAAVLQRADEPGEMLAYVENVLGRDRNAKPIKRGIGDAAMRLFNERNYLRYSSENRGIGFGGVIEMAQMQKAEGWKDDLFRYAIGVQHKREQDIPDSLTMLTERAKCNKMNAATRHMYAHQAMGNPEHPLFSAMAGQWEWVLSWLGDTKGSKAALTEKEKWGLVIPKMGIMAIVRNLRNFDEAGITGLDPAAQEICARLINAEQIAKSRMFPYRFFTAHLQLKSVTWTAALEFALQHSLQNIPEMPGRTLVLVDTSGSMESRLSSKSVMTYVQCAALFGVALKVKNPDAVNLWGFASGEFEAQASRGHSVLRCTEEFAGKVGTVGHGTEMQRAITNTYDKHDRVIIISDMQAYYGGSGYYGSHDVARSVPAHVPVYGYNLSSSSTTPLGQGNRHSLGGLTDATFKLIPQHERAGKGLWPWE